MQGTLRRIDKKKQNNGGRSKNFKFPSSEEQFVNHVMFF